MTPKRQTPPCGQPLTRGKRKGQPCGSGSVEGTDPPLCRRHMPADNVAHRKKALWLEAYATTGNVSAACTAADIARSTYYSWLDTDHAFVPLVAEAREHAIDELELEARRRAQQGTSKPMMYKGEPIIDPTTGDPVVIREYSDTLLIFLLKGLRPETYRERYDVTGKVDHEHRVDWSGASARLLDSLDQYAEQGTVELEQHANGSGG